MRNCLRRYEKKQTIHTASEMSPMKKGDDVLAFAGIGGMEEKKLYRYESGFTSSTGFSENMNSVNISL